MNEKLNLRQLAERLPAELFGAETEDRVTLVNEIFGITGETLSGGQSAVLPGFGTFELTGDNQNPIRFVPDKRFSDIVNAPFASFSPTVLAPEVTESALDAIVEPGEATEPEAVDVEPETTPEIDIVAGQESAAPEIAQAVEIGETVTTDEKEETTAPEPENEPDVAPADNVSEIESTTVEEDPQELIVPTTVKAEPEIDKIMSQAYSDQTEDPEEEETVEATQPDFENDEPKSGGSRFGIGYFWGLLTGLVVGALLFLGYVVITSGMISSSAESGLTVSDIDEPALVEGIE